MLDRLCLSELIGVISLGHRVFVNVQIPHQLGTDGKKWSRWVNYGEKGEITFIEPDPISESLRNGTYLPGVIDSFVGASDFSYVVDFGDVSNVYSSRHLIEPGYDGYPNDPLSIEAFFNEAEIKFCEDPRQLSLFDN